MVTSLAPVFAGILLLVAEVSALDAWRKGQLLDRQKNAGTLQSIGWKGFEALAGEAYRRKGYFVTESGGGGADGGVDRMDAWRSDCKRNRAGNSGRCFRGYYIRYAGYWRADLHPCGQGVGGGRVPAAQCGDREAGRRKSEFMPWPRASGMRFRPTGIVATEWVPHLDTFQ